MLLRMRALRVMGTCVVMLCVMACDESSDWPEENFGAAEQGIVNGSLDTTHAAVVTWLHGSKCSATIIGVNGGTGYALTAAHCVGGGLGNLYQGNNDVNADVVYPVTDATRHPKYLNAGCFEGTCTGFDVAMLTFSGASGATPTLPVLSKPMDNIVVGNFLLAVGYGATPSNNTLRRNANLAVIFESEVLVEFNQVTTGICSGDSGGPSLKTVSSVEYVAGVHSFVSQGGCTGSGAIGADIRTGPYLNTFINQYISGNNFGTLTCDECVDAHNRLGVCVDEIQTCFGSQPCQDWVDCVNNCNTQPCQIACGLSNPGGKTVYDAIDACACNSGCVQECAGDSMCDAPPQCYLTSSLPACQTCFETSCCNEVTACAADDFCFSCISSLTPDPNCPNDPTTSALLTCLSTNCDPECPGGNTSGSGGGGAGAGGMGAGGMGTGGAGVGADPTTVGAGGAGAGGNNVDDNEEPEVVEGGCGCRVDAPQKETSFGWLALLGLGLAGVRRRRQ
jgi:MYXO-CTERM domain-containing protein